MSNSKMGQIDGFYPTPPTLSKLLAEKIRWKKFNKHELKALEPEAGKGDLIKGVDEYIGSGWRSPGRIDWSAIEIDNDLRATLLGKNTRVIDEDFLSFSGVDKFDLIIMNPPFNGGDKHLQKAIEIMYRGQILCILNAETIRNQCTNNRIILAKTLRDLDAKIEFMELAFYNAEVGTDVEIAIIDIFIDNNVEQDLFKDMVDEAEEFTEGVETRKEVSAGKGIREMVAEYNQIIEVGTQTIIDYFRNYPKVGKYIGLDCNSSKSHSSPGDSTLTALMQEKVNVLLKRVRNDFWEQCLTLDVIRNRMTSKERDKFYHFTQLQGNMDFTERNIRTFILNLISNYENILTAAVLHIFDEMTKYGYNSMNKYEENIHYFNGWKTNDAFKVANKVILPMPGGCGDSAFVYGMGESWEKWQIHYETVKRLDDIDTVMNYFDGMAPYHPMSSAIHEAFQEKESRGIQSTYFIVNCYKKGTIHMKFRDPDILRRFNVTACKGKGWLPCNYGDVKYYDMEEDEKKVVTAFEDIMTYQQNVGKELLPSLTQKQLMLEM